MAHSLSSSQLKSLETTERVASCFSLVGTTFVMVTFMYSSEFRKPINRLVFYASIGNTLCNIATLMSYSGVRQGKNSHLCQFQGFLIQMFLPADALWNLAMAINVYLTLFRKYNSQQLKALEWRYHLMAYGAPFVVALVYIFVKTKEKGHIYGPASLWCWVSIEWVALRVALCYGPAWICIIVAFTIYSMAGRQIYMNHRQLRLLCQLSKFPRETENPFDGYKTTEVNITSELAPYSHEDLPVMMVNANTTGSMPSGRGYDRYTVTIASMPVGPRMDLPQTPSGLPLNYRRNRAALEANTAAWAYTKCALLFFVSLLITWVPSSINRVYSLLHPSLISVPFTYASGVVLPLMGFWNSVIYITTSWTPCKMLFAGLFRPGSLNSHTELRSKPRSVGEQRLAVARSGASVSDSLKGLAGEDAV